jgi:chromosome segregation ATPase
MEINGLQREHRDISRAFEAATEENARLREALTALKSKRKKRPSGKEQARLKRTQSKLKDEMSGLKGELAEHRAAAQEYRSQANDLATQCREHEEYIKHLREKLKAKD